MASRLAALPGTERGHRGCFPTWEAHPPLVWLVKEKRLRYALPVQSKATTVQQYLTSLPPDRCAALSAVRDVILRNLDKDYEEGVQYGMIGFFVPHRVFPAGYHCDPKQPLPFAGLASQKNHMSLYMMSLYGAAGSDRPDGGTDHERWFREAWAKTGKKLDMGKSCIRFKKLDDLALDVIAEAIRRMPAKAYISQYESALQMNKKAPASATKATERRKEAAKPPAKQAAPKKKPPLAAR
jgi:hypothetical protein